jgi:hypothetical protein
MTIMRAYVGVTDNDWYHFLAARRLRLRRPILMSTDRGVDDLFRQHGRILQTSDRWLELPEKVQQQSAATAPAEISLRPTPYEPLTCASDLRRPFCLQMVRRRSSLHLDGSL